jgi:outer membrane receptor protein involved in Fe transport
MTAGIDGYLFRLDNPSELFDYYNDTYGTVEGYKGAGQQNMGAFINDEWQIGEKWQIVSGIRYDAATVLEGKKNRINGRNEKREAFSGNAGFVYSPNNTTHISFNAGRAFVCQSQRRCLQG